MSVQKLHGRVWAFRSQDPQQQVAAAEAIVGLFVAGTIVAGTIVAGTIVALWGSDERDELQAAVACGDAPATGPACGRAAGWWRRAAQARPLRPRR
jgi:hypothetical protein